MTDDTSIPPEDGSGPGDARPEDAEAARLFEAGLSDPTPTGRAQPPSPQEIAPHFPELEILEILGHGGMGVVYKARQRKLDRLVALKVLPRELADDPTFAERFAREARTMAKLDHPNIVRVHELGEHDGLYYLLLEYVAGASLRQVMNAGALAPAEALAIVPQICEALQYAHDQGIVHRDVKPENILIDERGRVKIADFGLAKLTERGPADLTLTGTQQVVGTFQYMAPEQYRSPQAVDHRADIFSLGVVFYEMLTGELPVGRFDKPSETHDLDQRIDAIVLRALEREREQRYQKAEEVQRDVTRVSDAGAAESHPGTSMPAPATAQAPARLRGGGLLIAAAAMIPLGVLAGVFIREMHRRVFEMDVPEAWDLAAWACGLVFLVGAILAAVAGLRAAGEPRLLRTRRWSGVLVVLNLATMVIFGVIASQEARNTRRLRKYPELFSAMETALSSSEARRNHGFIPMVEGVTDWSDRKEIVEGVLRTWELYVSLVRDADLDLNQMDTLYSAADMERIRDLAPLELAGEKTSHELGMGVLGRETLSVPPHHLKVHRIVVNDWENEARVQVVKQSPPYDFALDFPMKRSGSRWFFTLGEVTVKKSP